MSQRIATFFKGDGLGARTMRSTALTVVSFGGEQVLRLISNLILTRLLFPEAFGLMALVTVFMVALQMFSDTGINASIIQSKRGEDPTFLNTAWTVQIVRGLILWLAACAIALPVANFYDQPLLAQLLPVTGINALVLGALSTNAATVNRKLMLGRLTAMTLGAQLVGIVVMIALAYLLQSVWALVWGGLVGTLLRVGLSHLVLPGIRNRIQFDRSAFFELFHFGKYIFLGTIAGFMINNGDRAILGKFISIGDLGIYNIGFFLATVPLTLNRTIGKKVMFPLYSARPPHESAGNQAKIFRTRRLLTAGMLALCIGLGLSGDWLVRLLYSEPYHGAGPILVLLSIAIMPVIVTSIYPNVMLSQGNSRDFTIFLVISATVQTGAMLWGVQHYGLAGAIAALPFGALAAYPLLIWMIQRYKAWDPVHDIGYFALTAGAVALIWWVNAAPLSTLF